MASLPLQIFVWFTIIYGLDPVQGLTERIDTDISVPVHEAQYHVIALKNYRLLLNCSVSSPDLPLSYYWKKNGKRINLGNDNRIQQVKNGSLYFRKVLQKKKKNITDEGLYECFVRNSKGIILARRVKLEIASKEKRFSMQPQDQVAIVGGVARFQCQIRATPPRLYLWKRNDEAISADARHVFISTGVLQILDIEPGDAGQYHCTAYPGNLHNLPDTVPHFKWKSSDDALLTVNPGTGSRPPVIVAPPQNTSVIEGQSAVLECLVDGSPKPTVTWRREDGNNVLGSGVVMYGETNLKFLEVKPSNSDTYYCDATSEGKTVTATAILDVQTHPVIIQELTSVKLPAAHTSRFKCQVDGNPKPKVTWLKDGQVRQQTSSPNSKLTELVITGTVLTDSGYYQCVAENNVGYTMSIGRLKIFSKENVPSPPEHVTAVVKSSTEVLVQWEPSKSLSEPLLAYSLDIQETERPEEKKNYVISSMLTSKVVTDLRPYTSYSLYVRAYNRLGASSLSELVTMTTFEGFPSAAPMIRVRATKPTSIDIEWDELPKHQRNGEIVAYKILYRVEQSTQPEVIDIRKTNSRSYTITGLEPSTTYEMCVFAATKLGYPSLSEAWVKDTTLALAAQNVSGPNPPSMEVIPINATSVNVTWEQESHGVPVTSYKLQLVWLNNPNKKRQFMIPPSPNFFTLTELDNETYYQVSLIAKNEHGSSGPVIEEFLTEENLPPLPPRGLTASQISSKSMLLTWTQPDSPVKISHYTVRYQPWIAGKNLGMNDAMYLRSDGTEVVLEELMPYTFYNIDVKAVSLSVEGKYSQSIMRRTKEDVPSEPRNLHVVVMTKDGLVQIKWRPPARPNGKITAYIIKFLTDDIQNNHWKTVLVNGSLTSAKIGDQNGGGTYLIKILACTRAGAGPSSDEITVATNNKPDPPAQPLAETNNQLGIILGVSICVVCIIICVFIVVFRNKCFSNGEPHSQPVHANGNGFVPRCNGNGHVLLRIGDREMHEMEPYTPMLGTFTENHHDSKGCGSGNLIVTPNGSRINGYVPFSNGLRNGHIPNGHVTSFINSCKQSEQETQGLIAAVLAAGDDGLYSDDKSSTFKPNKNHKSSLDGIDHSSGSEQTDSNKLTNLPRNNVGSPKSGHCDLNVASSQPQELSQKERGHSSEVLEEQHRWPPDHDPGDSMKPIQQHKRDAVSSSEPHREQPGTEHSQGHVTCSLPQKTRSCDTQPSSTSPLTPPPNSAVSTSSAGGSDRGDLAGGNNPVGVPSHQQPKNLSSASRGDRSQGEERHGSSTSIQQKQNGRGNPPYPGRLYSQDIYSRHDVEV